MIYQYEAAILNYLNSVLPDLKLMTYAKQQDMFNAMSQVTYYPALFYNRESTNWSFNKFFPIDGVAVTTFVPFEQVYTGRILLENQKKVFELANKLRFAWHKNPYLSIQWPDSENILKVGLRLLYIKVDEDRAPDDKKGTQRYVEFQWKSQLFMSEDTIATLTEQIRIHLVGNGDPYTEAQIYNGDYLVKTISLVNN